MSDTQTDTPNAGAEAPTPEAAKAQIAQYQQDRTWMGEYFNGDRAKADEMSRLFEAAYPDPEKAGAAAVDQVPDVGEEWLARPASIEEYDFSALRTEDPDTQLELQHELRQSLHAEGVPRFAVGVAMTVMARNLEHGVPDEAALEQSKIAGMAELELRHGGKAKEVLAAAAKTFARLEKRDPRIGDFLCASGAVNNPWLIETLAQLWEQKYSRL